MTKKLIDSLSPSGSRFVWDSDLPGFGVRVAKNGTKTFVVQYRVGGGRGGLQRRVTIGSDQVFTVDAARQRAKVALAKARLNQDVALERDAARRAETVAELIDAWKSSGALRNRRTGALRKAANVAGEFGRVDAHILPLLGAKRLATLCRRDIEEFRDAIALGKSRGTRVTKRRGRARVRGGEGTATRTVRLLGSILAWGVERGMLKANPVAGVRLPTGRRIERFLSEEELHRLGSALRRLEAEGRGGPGIPIISLLALTGARRGEVEGLRWDEVDLPLHLLRLADSKTGQKIVRLSDAAVDILARQPRQEGTPYVFPAATGSGHFQGLGKVWQEILDIANFAQHTRIHDLRHTYASFGVMSSGACWVIANPQPPDGTPTWRMIAPRRPQLRLPIRSSRP